MLSDTSSEAPAPRADIRTFLFADLRGYTRYTHEHGDEAASALAARFADIVRDTVPEFEGELLEVRGDEALCVFSSARQALRAAVELQRSFRKRVDGEPVLPVGAGMGLDAGEAVPTQGGYRGGALNVAARLCALAAPGQVLATEIVVGLARRVEGLQFQPRRPVQVKGLAEPVRSVEVVSETPLPPVPVVGPQRRSSLGRSVAVPVVAIAILAASVWVATSRLTSRSGMVVAANSVAAIDAHTNRVVADVAVGATPTLVAAGSGYVWVLNSNNKTISRIDPRRRQAAGSPFSVSATPTGLAAGAGSLWVGAGDKNAVLRVNPTTEQQEVPPIHVPGGVNPYQPVVVVSFGAGQVYVISSGGTIGRLDPAVNKFVKHVLGPGGSAGNELAANRSGLFVTSTFRVDHLDPRQLSPINHKQGPQYPGAITFGAGSAWVTDESGNSVWRIDPDLGLIDTIPVSGRPSAITFGAGAVWVATPDGIVTRIDPNTGTTTPINVGGTPASLAIGGGLVWVAVV